jgi:hypothetical protein
MNVWNTTIEQQIQNWKYKCELYHQLHEQYKQFYMNAYSRATNVTILLSSLSTMFGSILIVRPNFVVNLLLLCCNIGIAAIQTYTISHSIIEKLSKHHELSTKYMELIYNIEQELALPEDKRTNGEEFIKMLSLQMIHLLELSDHLPMMNQINMVDAQKMYEAYTHQLEYSRDCENRMLPALNCVQQRKFNIYYTSAPHVSKEFKMLKSKTKPNVNINHKISTSPNKDSQEILYLDDAVNVE